MQSAALLLAAISAALSARADTFYWNNASGGYWDVAANWTSDSGSGTYPGNASQWDGIGKRKVNAPFTITLRKDERAWTCNVSELNNGTGYQTVDLGGHYLYLGQLYFAGCGTSSGLNVLPARGFEFKNGTVDFYPSNGFGMGYWSQDNPGTIVFTHCTVTGRCYIANAQSTITVRDGSTWVLNGDTYVNFPAEASTPMGCRNAFITVTGETSRVIAPKHTLRLCHIQTGLFLFDGTSANFTNLYVGATARSTNVLAKVCNATLAVENLLQLGSGLAGGTGSKLYVSGASSRVTAGEMRLHDGQNVLLDLAVPTDAFGSAAPFELGSLSIVPRGEDLPDSGDLTFALTCYEWVKAHPNETIPLVRLETADAASLAALAEKVSYRDVPASLVEQGLGPTLSVSADGTTLNMTAPELNYDPVFLLSTQAKGLVGAKQITVRLVAYGADATSITDVYCQYADNPEFTGSVITNFLQGKSAISTATPCDNAFVLDGGFIQHRTYHARIICLNDQGRQSSQDISFESDAVAETFTWPQNVSGFFEDVTKWRVNGAVPTSWPHAEDTVGWIYDAAHTISFAEDAAIVRFANGWSSSKPLTLALNGHTLTLNGTNAGDANLLYMTGWVWGQDDWSTVGGVVVVSGGTLRLLRNGIMLGYAGQQASDGTLIVENGAVCDAAIRYMNNSSRIFVRSGGVLAEGALKAGVQFCNHTGIAKYPRVSVEGAGSRIAVPNGTVVVRGFGSAMRILDGAAVESKNFSIGGSSFVYAGSVLSSNTCVTVSNGTVGVGGYFQIGWTNNLSCGPRLFLQGTNSTISADGVLRIHEGMNALIEYDLPQEGFARNPFVAGSLEIVPKPEVNEDFGPTRFALRGVKKWAKANPKETVNLVQLTTPNQADLERLKTCVETDWPELPEGCISVTAEGKILQLKAPPRQGFVIRVR